MPVPNSKISYSNEATVKLDQAQDAVTIKIASGSEEEIENIDSTTITGVPKPIYLQTKWLASAAIVVVFIAYGIIKLSDEKEDKITPVVQVLPEPEQVVVEEISETEESSALTLEEQTKIEELLILAEEDITALRLTRPNENNALNKYLSILMIDENNIKANEGIRLVSDKYISLAYGAIQSNNLAKADKYIKKAKRIYSESDKIAPARSALQAKYEEQKISETDPEPEVEKPADKNEQISDTEEESSGFWDSIKKWNEENKNIEYEESESDKVIKKHFNL